MLETTLQTFTAKHNAGELDTDTLKELMSQVISDVGEDRDCQHAAITHLAPLVAELSHPFHAVLLSVLIGYFIENGADPRLSYQQVIARGGVILNQMVEFATTCLETPIAGLEADEDTDMGEWISAHVSANGEAVTAQHPELAAAWEAGEILPNALMAHLRDCPDARVFARTQSEFTTCLSSLSDNFGQFYWCRVAAEILNDEELVVLNPASNKGYRVLINDITDNFQLHILLAAALNGPDGLPYPKPEEEVTAVFLNKAPTDGSTQATGCFNMVNWTSLHATDDEDFYGHWIWNESSPYDIEAFEGTRIILIDDAPYQRSWNAESSMPWLNPEVKVLEELTPQQVEEWMQRLKAAKPERAS